MKYSVKKAAIGTFLFFLLYSILHGQELSRNSLFSQDLRKSYIKEQISLQYAKERNSKKESTKEKSESTKGINGILSKSFNFKEGSDLFSIGGTPNSLNLKRSFGKLDLAGTAIDGKKEDSYGIAAKLGGTYFTINPATGNYLAGHEQRFGKNTVSVSYDSLKGEAYIRGKIEPINNLKLAVNVNDVFGHHKSIDVQANLKLDDIAAYARFCNQLGRQSIFLGAEYSFDGVKLQLNAQRINNRNDLYIALKILEALSVQYGNKSFLAKLNFKI